MKYDKKTYYLVYYMCDELIKLINMNDDKFTKITICNIIVDCIIHISAIFNKDEINSNSETIKFSYVLNSTVYAKEMVQDIIDKTDGGFYEEYIDTSKDMDEKELQNNIDDDIEQSEALDVDIDVDDNGDADDENIIDMIDD